jgi:hypothetical protein
LDDTVVVAVEPGGLRVRRHAGARDSRRPREHPFGAHEQDPLAGGQRCRGAESCERGAVERDRHGDTAKDLAFREYTHLAPEHRPAGLRDGLAAGDGSCAGNRRGQTFERLLISRRKRTLEPWLGGEGRRPLLRLRCLTRGFAQRGLERDAEVRGHSALLLLADRVRDRKADARECGAEEYDD